MYPFLRPRVVLVDGPAATGIYDLNQGTFERVTFSAAAALRRADGTIQATAFSAGERAFLDGCVRKGLVETQCEPTKRAQTALQDVIRPLRPVRFVWVELTSRCNQLCKHCFLGEDLNKFPHLTKKQILGMMPVLDAAGARQLVLSGGEPLAHPEFDEILDDIGSNFRFRLSVLTNGSHSRLLRSVETFLRHDVTLKIPLLGWNETHDRMAGLRGAFKRTIDNIQRLTSSGVRVELGSTITAINSDDIPRLIEFATHSGLPLEFSPLYGVGYAKINYAELTGGDHQKMVTTCRKANEQVSALMPGLGAKPLTRKANGAAKYDVIPSDYDSVNLRDYLTEHHECGQKIIAVLSNGYVTPCLMLRHRQFSLGSIHEQSLEAILRHETRDARLLDALMRIANIPGCSVCEARFVCKAGGCPAAAHAALGSVALKNPFFRKCYYLPPHSAIGTDAPPKLVEPSRDAAPNPTP